MNSYILIEYCIILYYIISTLSLLYFFFNLPHKNKNCIGGDLIVLNLFEPIINSLVNSIHKSYLKDSFINDFIHDLQRYMFRQNLDYDYSKLPKSTIFEVDYIEDGFASCLDTSQKHSEKYCIPSELLDESAKKADYIQFDGKKYIAVYNPYKNSN